MLRHADVGVVGSCFGGGEQDERGVQAGGLVGAGDELFADALFLKGFVHGQVREVCAEVPIGDRAGDAHESALAASGDDEASVLEHACEGAGLVNGATLGERGAPEHITKFLNPQLRFNGVVDGVGVLLHDPIINGNAIWRWIARIMFLEFFNRKRKRRFCDCVTTKIMRRTVACASGQRV